MVTHLHPHGYTAQTPRPVIERPIFQKRIHVIERLVQHSWGFIRDIVEFSGVR